MRSPSSRKCCHCREHVVPSPNNRPSQRDCCKPLCRKGSKAATQAKWVNKAENRHSLPGSGKGGVNCGSRFGVGFANRATEEVRHEEFIAQDRESDGSVQPGDEAGANRGSDGSVVFANGASAEVRHEEGVALHCEKGGGVQPR